MNNNILKAADLYAGGLAKVLQRRDKWQAKYKVVREMMKAVADTLNKEATYKARFYVDTSHAYNEQINGTCEKMPSVTFRSGDMPLYVSFRNSASERIEYVEHGFQLSFTPTITGQLLILLRPHYTSLSEAKPDYLNLGVIDDADELTQEAVEDILAQGIEAAYYTSFTGVVDLQEKEVQQAQQQHYSPIGFKKYETTEESTANHSAQNSPIGFNRDAGA